MAKQIYVINAGKLIDGKTEKVFHNYSVLVEGSTIREVGPTDQITGKIGKDVPQYDYTSYTVVPGLIDCHVHLTMPGDGTPLEEAMDIPDEVITMRAAYNAKQALKAGTTTLREMGAKNRSTFILRESIQKNLAIGPRLFLSGRPITCTGGHMWMMGSQADGPDDIRKEVRKLVKEGADFIKLVATGGATIGTVPYKVSYTLQELEAAVDEAHRHGRQAAIHVLSKQGVVNAIDAGGDLLVHCMFRSSDGTAAYDEQLANKIASSKIPVNPTLHVLRHRVWRLEEKAKNEGLNEEEKSLLDEEQQTLEMRLNMIRNLHQLGVKMLPGSDTAWYWYPVGQYVAELDALVQAGLKPIETLMLGTLETAKAIGEGSKLGSIEPGKLADLLIVDGDPSIDINALWNVKAVFQGGNQVDLTA